MFKNHSATTYLTIFIILSIILKIVGFLNISYTELAGYALIFYGIANVYTKIGSHRKTELFAATCIFLIGVILFIISNYDISRISIIILPSIFFILGTSFLVLFIDDSSNKLLIIISAIFFVSGIFFFSKLGTFSVSDFIKSFLNLIVKYWTIVVIVTAIILLLKKGQRS